MAALAALLAPAQSSALADEERLVEACQIAVKVHADGVLLDFPAASRDGVEVHLGFSFVNTDRSFSGEARCVFHNAASPVAPPSLLDLDVMGRINPARFLVSHNAVWGFFTGRRMSEAAGPSAPTNSPSQPPGEGAQGPKLAEGKSIPAG